MSELDATEGGLRQETLLWVAAFHRASRHVGYANQNCRRTLSIAMAAPSPVGFVVCAVWLLPIFNLIGEELREQRKKKAKKRKMRSRNIKRPRAPMLLPVRVC
mmetsp:Transcript_59422/g.112146  ORF Transcript_59422/g.112146 Transcript_59422/m.112146 type:complete len:103 (-) Transcript_59422:851-1159(-)